MEEPACIICDSTEQKDLFEIKQRGLSTLIKSSKKRFDNKYSKMKKFSAFVHKNCQKTYNNENSIKASRQSKQRRSTETQTINKEAKAFNFSTCCFFCGTDCTHLSKKFLCSVSSNNTKENIINFIEKKNNE